MYRNLVQLSNYLHYNCNNSANYYDVCGGGHVCVLNLQTLNHKFILYSLPALYSWALSILLPDFSYSQTWIGCSQCNFEEKEPMTWISFLFCRIHLSLYWEGSTRSLPTTFFTVPNFSRFGNLTPLQL